MEVLQHETNLISSEQVTYCVFHEQDGYPSDQNPADIISFPFSQCFCPKRTQLVISLLKALLDGGDKPLVNSYHFIPRKVRILHLTITIF
jgi:hypothetical protein